MPLTLGLEMPSIQGREVLPQRSADGRLAALPLAEALGEVREELTEAALDGGG